MPGNVLDQERNLAPAYAAATSGSAASSPRAVEPSSGGWREGRGPTAGESAGGGGGFVQRGEDRATTTQTTHPVFGRFDPRYWLGSFGHLPPHYGGCLPSYLHTAVCHPYAGALSVSCAFGFWLCGSGLMPTWAAPEKFCALHDGGSSLHPSIRVAALVEYTTAQKIRTQIFGRFGLLVV